MKRIFKVLLLVMVLTGSMVFFSCNDDDKNDITDITITLDKLPQEARSFISKFYGEDEVIRIEMETDNGQIIYQVYFQSGHEVVFNSEGVWQQVDAPDNDTIPTGIAPENIVDFINTNYSGYGINEINKTGYGYNVELVTGLDLQFDPQGNYLGLGDEDSAY